MYRILALLCLFAWCFHARAQDFNNYQPLRSSGTMPEKFITSSTEKYLKDKAEKISDSDKRKDRKAKEEFLLSANFQIDRLLLSGQVLFNDPVTLYINKVLDQVLKDDPKLRSEIEAYAVKSPAVNAFATDNGIILVNIGLIAHLENEAQLAYVLSHEITHYKKQHSMDEYAESKRIEKGRGMYKGTTFDQKLLARSNYSKEKESEADLEGLKTFLKSNYSITALDGVFNALIYAGQPYADKGFDKSFLERGSLLISGNYWLSKPDTFKGRDDNDSLSTHPAVSKRRKAVHDLLKDEKSEGRKDFLVSESEFMRVRKICRFESTEQYINERDFESALYNSYLLLQEYPHNTYLKKKVFEALYGLAKYQNGGRLEEVHIHPDYITGSSQRINYLVQETSPGELSLMALVQGWELKKQYPNDRKLQAEVNDIFRETVEMHYKDISYFSTAPRSADTTPVVVKEAPKKSPAKKTPSKKKTPKKKRKKSNKTGMARYALVELLQDTEFVAQYKSYAKEAKKKRMASRKPVKKVTDADGQVEEVYDEDKDIQNGNKPEINKILIVNPYYYFIKTTGKTGIKYLKSESGQRKYNELLKETADRVGIEYTMLDSKDLEASSVTTFNDISALNEYFSQVLNDDEVTRINHMEPELQAIKEKYHTRYVCWTAVISTRTKDETLGALAISSMGCFILWPVVIVKAIMPDYRTYFYTIVMDLETGKTMLQQGETYRIKDDKDVMKGMMYYTFSAIKLRQKGALKPKEVKKK